MPRFFFDVHDGVDMMDDIGAELPDMAAARRYALRYAGSLIAGMEDDFWVEGDWRIEVRTDRGLILFSLMLIALDAPVLARHRV